MSTHTPGPWTWTWQEERTCYALKGCNGQVLEITKGLTPTIDDQRLIAAAPALLEALEAANVPHTMPAVHKMTDVVAGCPGCMARAAIRAAKGESNG